MTSEIQDLTDRIFYRAKGFAPGRRTAFLAAACGGDPELRREVESLLAAADEMDEGFLETPVLPLGDRPHELRTGSRLGVYRVGREIGRGGMGKVYQATRDDGLYQQEVAIKVLKRGLDTEEILRRFRHERRILARLDHPSIARILDGGSTGDSLPYLVMEHVDGEPIDRYCDARKLPVRARLGIFRQVCSAVHFAHQNLVVHRDLKADNILITGGGEPKLLDFGIAKLLEPGEAPLTRVGPQPMTPEHASPEQIANRPVTTASDVFALGGLLYQLLTGRHPHHGSRASPRQLRRAIRDLDPEPPSRVVGRGLARRLAGDLDSIVLKAMEKEPQRRYSSVERFSEDLRRHLEGLPVVARQATARYRLGKFVRRHRLGVTVATAALVGILGFGIGMTILWDQAVRERRRAEVATRFLAEVFLNPDPRVSKGEDVTARQLLDEGAERIREELQGQPEVRAALMNAMGQAYLGLALYREAAPLLEESLELRRSSRHTRPEELATSLFNLEAVRRAEDQHQAADALAREAQEVLRRAGVADTSLAGAFNNQAGLLKAQGDLRTAEDLYREVLAMKIRLYGQEHPSVARGKNNLAAVLKDQGKYHDAEKLYHECLALRIKLHGEPSAEVATTLNNFGQLLKDRGDLDGAETMLLKALEMRCEVFGSDHPKVGNSLVNLGAFLEQRGSYAEAEALYAEAMELFTSRYGEDHSKVAVVLRNQATLFLAQGKGEEGEAAARRALEILRQARSEGDWRIAVVESVLGSCLVAMGRYQEAKPLLRESYQVLRQVKGDEAGQTREALGRLEQLDEVWGRTIE